MPSNRVTRVYGDGGGMEHGQERPAGAKTTIHPFPILRKAYPVTSGQKDSILIWGTIC